MILNLTYLIIFILYFVPILGIIVNLISYIITLLKIPFYFLPVKKNSHQHKNLDVKNGKLFLLISWINLQLGKLEYYLRIPRNILCFLYALSDIFIILYKINFLDNLAIKNHPLVLPLAVLFLAIHSQKAFKLGSLKLAELVDQKPYINPTDFFNYIYHLFGPLKDHAMVKKDYPNCSPQNTSFQKMKRPKQKISPLIKNCFDTAYLANICLHVHQLIGPKYALKIFDLMAMMWGKRSLENSQNKMITTGLDKLKNLSGKVIIVMNHKSTLDFILCFFALSQVKLKRGRFLRPRFIAAKDHMMDNPFIYHILGVGKLIESVGMVFIERKKAGFGIQSLASAASSLANNEIDIAIFPQGTRAEGNLDRSGKRRDAGYYTTFSKKLLHLEEGHLRKGTAFLAIDTLIALNKSNQSDPVHLVFVGLEGTATTVSKQSFFVQTETEINFNIGDILTLTQDNIKDLKKPEKLDADLSINEKNYLNFVDQLHRQIDQSLTKSISIKENLLHRFHLELNGNLRYPMERINIINNKIKELDSTTNIIYRILDRIFASNPNTWNGNLTRVAQALLEVNPTLRLKQLNEEISLTMIANLKKKAHGKKIK